MTMLMVKDMSGNRSHNVYYTLPLSPAGIIRLFDDLGIRCRYAWRSSRRGSPGGRGARKMTFTHAVDAKVVLLGEEEGETRATTPTGC